MKTLEKIIKFFILAVTECNLDPLQFAYRSGRGVDDAKLFILNTLYRHLEGPQTHARIVFADFSSAFNTIQPHILANKLVSYFSLDNHLVLWIIDFLTNRLQRDFVNGCFSELSLTRTGSPQGCVLSPLLYILYTDDCRSNHLNRFLVKFADDSALPSLLQGSEQYHGLALTEFVDWCDNCYLDLNVTKTKEMTVDFRRQEHSPGKTIMHNNEVEIVSKYKYLGTIVSNYKYLGTIVSNYKYLGTIVSKYKYIGTIVSKYKYLGAIFDDKLKWDDNTEEIVKKGQQLLYLLRKLNYFSVDQKILTLFFFFFFFYKSFIESVLSFSCICWFHSLGLKNRKSLQRIVRIASMITAVPQRDVALICEQQILRKARSILTKKDHILNKEFTTLPSGRRLRCPICKTKMLRTLLCQSRYAF